MKEKKINDDDDKKKKNVKNKCENYDDKHITISAFVNRIRMIN